MIDFHSHVLPEIDDGSNSVFESLQMLKQSWNMGVDTMVATPHFYAENESIARFSERRQESYKKLTQAIDGYSCLPRIIMGSETAFFAGMSREKDISKLCIGDTKYLLLEMPFTEWTSLTIKEVQALISNRGIMPIIAHLERFFQIQGHNGKVEELLNMRVMVQTNGEAFTNVKLRRRIMRMISKNEIQLLGSDCHNIRKLPPNLDTACKIILSRLGEEQLRKIDFAGRAVLRGEQIK